jgi:hypothetical protein
MSGIHTPVGSFRYTQDVHSARLPTQRMTSHSSWGRRTLVKTFLSHPVKTVFLFLFRRGRSQQKKKKKSFSFLVCTLLVLNVLSFRKTNNLVSSSESIEVGGGGVMVVGCARKNSQCLSQLFGKRVKCSFCRWKRWEVLNLEAWKWSVKRHVNLTCANIHKIEAVIASFWCFTTECCWVLRHNGITQHLYSSCAYFESRSGHKVSRMSVIAVFLNISRQLPDSK